MTHGCDTYADWAARQRRAKQEAKLFREKEKVWRAHLKRQYKQLMKFSGTRNSRLMAFIIVSGRVEKLRGNTGNRPIARARYLTDTAHKARLSMVDLCARHQPLP